MPRSHLSLRIVGLGLVAFACQSALAAMFSVSSGTCTLSGDCIRTPNYPSSYDNNIDGIEGGDCTFTTLAAGSVSTTAFSTEATHDKLIIGGTYYSGTTGPSGVSVTSGEQITWDVDFSIQRTGWELCLTAAGPTPSPTPATTRMSTTGTCTLSTSGDCVSSPNYPSTYDSTDCTITNNQAGYLTAGIFYTEAGYDTLNIRRRGLGAYSGRRRSTSQSTILNVYLEAGEQIEWAADTSGAFTGWQLCNTATASGTLALTSAPTSAPGSSSATCCTGTSCEMYTGTCGALGTETDCWSSGYCYADSADGCCETNGGAIAGILIAILVFCVIIPVVCCCFFCGSCPMAKSRNQKTVVHVQQIQPEPVSQPIAPAPIVHQPVQPPPQAIPMAAQPIAMVAQPIMKQEAPPMAPPPPGQSGVQYGAAPPPPPYQPQGAPPAASAPAAFCASCGAANNSGAAFCANCGAQL